MQTIDNTKIQLETQKLIHSVEQKDFKDFLEAFYQAYHHPITPKEKALMEEQELCQAMEKFMKRLVEEASKLAAQGENAIASSAPYITVARAHPVLMFFCTQVYLVKEYGFCEAKKENAEPLKHLCTQQLTLLLMQHILGEPFKKVEICLTVYSEFKAEVSLLSQWCEASDFKPLYEYYSQAFHKSDTTEKLPSQKLLNKDSAEKLLTELLTQLKQAQEPVQSRILSVNLHFLLAQGYALPNGESSSAPWYPLFPWETLSDNQLFILEQVEKDKDKIVAYLKTQHPKLILNQLMKGNFLIAELLLELGLSFPKLSAGTFISQAISFGLQNSREIKIYHAFFLLLIKQGIIDNSELQSLDKLLDKSRLSTLKSKVLNSLAQFIKQYFEMHDQDLFNLTLGPELFKRISDLMLTIEKDYALALSEIYHLPRVNAKNTLAAYRGITIPKSKLNKKIPLAWFNYGHRANIYPFLGHGYNRAACDELEDNNDMISAGAGGSATTRLSPVRSYGYAHSDEYSDGFILSLTFKEGDPVFLGNIPTGTEKVITDRIPSELEQPLCFPETIVSIHYLSYKENTQINLAFRKLHNNDLTSSLASPTVEQENKAFADKAQEQVERETKQFIEDLAPYRTQCSYTYKKYLETHSSKTMLNSFIEHYKQFGSSSLRLKQLRPMLTQFLDFSSSTKVLDYLEPFPISSTLIGKNTR